MYIMKSNASSFTIRPNDPVISRFGGHGQFERTPNPSACIRPEALRQFAKGMPSSDATRLPGKRPHRSVRPNALKRHLPQVPSAIGSAGGWTPRSARAYRFPGADAGIYDSWIGNRRALANWTADDFESDFDWLCDSVVEASDFPGLRLERAAQRHFE
jgi:hypothetical protein